MRGAVLIPDVEVITAQVLPRARCQKAKESDTNTREVSRGDVGKEIEAESQNTRAESREVRKLETDEESILTSRRMDSLHSTSQ